VPRTLVPTSIEDAERFCQSLEFPCLVKPCQSHLYYARFKVKMIEVDRPERLMEVYRRAAEAGFEVMIQELIPGPDANGANYNSYFWQGQPVVEFTAKKVRNGPPRFGSPRVVVSQHLPEVLEPGRRILQSLGFSGYSCVEFKQDPRDGIYKLIEVNGRHNLSTLLAVRCGLNFPWKHYRHLVLGELPTQEDFPPGIYWIDLMRDLGYSLKHVLSERLSPAQFFRPYLNPHVFAVLDWSDPRPFLRWLVRSVKKPIAALFSRTARAGQAANPPLAVNDRLRAS